MSRWDPLGAPADEAPTVYDFEPTPVADAAGVGFGSLSGGGRHEATVKPGAHKMPVDIPVIALYVWFGLMTVLGCGFVAMLLIDLKAPPWLALALASVPGLCLMGQGLLLVAIVRRCTNGR